MKENEYELKRNNNQYAKEYIWNNAIGLQDVDNIKPSEYLRKIAYDNINKELSFENAKKLLSSYYNEKPSNSIESRTKEADIVSLRIAEILSENSFSFSLMSYINIHKRLFKDIYDHAGTLRTFNISKPEWILNENSVIYGNAYDIKDALEYDFEREKKFNYSSLDINKVISHIAKFISDIWQIHAFMEGNTRTTAVFLILYLNYLGFEVTNESFSNNSWYFRNALVRANYNNYKMGISSTTKYLELFLRNLLLNENNELSNRKLRIDYNENINISSIQLNIINLIKEKPNITLKEISEKTNKSLRTINSIVKELENKKIIYREGSKKTGLWRTYN